ncbi:glycosyltransferase [Litorihabitans aurantiacus]|uniref:Glycosyl transferase n=1 Tax=Litorihabitans aurantiacus TaxID=1930061 RepID=A0AA38CQV4_9MICO|nr:glycosyltransferase [Litorihabitans aurantiacus]GMA31436.1 glycosyl transferase [Litorihabitans aurantiacus]
MTDASSTSAGAASPRPRLLLAAPPFAGHLNPLLTLGLGLRERGFDVEVATGATKVPLVRGLGLRAHPLLADDPDAFDAIAQTPGPVRSNPLLLTRQLRANLALLPRARAELDAVLAAGSFDAVVADFAAPVAGYAAQAAGLPWITTTPSPCALETRTGTPSYCGGWGPATQPWHRVRDAAGRMATRVAKRGMQLALRRAFARAGTGVYRADGSEAAYSPTAILGLGALELELPRDWPAAFRMIGPVTATPERLLAGGGDALRPHLLPDGPLVLVTVGTHLDWARRDLVTQVRALAAAVPSHTFVVSLGRVGDDVGPTTDDEERDGRGAGRVVVVDHLPYDEVMARFDAVVHHGGAGVSYSAIRAGVPALVHPRDFDQFDMAARIVAAGSGRRARRPLDHPATARELRAVLGGDRTRLRELAAAVARYDPVAATAEIVTAAIASAPAGSGA